MKTTRPILVQKFGGTSVGSVARIHHVASLALAAQRQGYDVVVVVSAMSGETNRLLGLADEISDNGSKRERDTLAASGEQASAALTAIAIQAAGGKARSFLGHQVPILTDANFTDAHITKVETERLKEALSHGEIPVVAGFQGVDQNANITTLGRGGSDTTAVAVAAALHATCDIYTDVDGVYTADPNVVPSARKLMRVPYQHMLTFAALGAKVLHDRCIELAQKHKVVVQVRTSFGDTPGTLITPDEKSAQKAHLGGCACDRKLLYVSSKATSSATGNISLVNALAEKGVKVVASFSQAQRIALCIRTTEMPELQQLLKSREFPIVCIEPSAIVSLVGTRLTKDSRIEAKARNLIIGFGIQIKGQITQDTNISFLVDLSQADEVMRILHDGMAIGVTEGYGEASKPLRRRI